MIPKIRQLGILQGTKTITIKLDKGSGLVFNIVLLIIITCVFESRLLQHHIYA